MPPAIDTSAFPVGRTLDYESEEEFAQLEVMKTEAWRFVTPWRWWSGMSLASRPEARSFPASSPRPIAPL
jgi:hypothetical protein